MGGDKPKEPVAAGPKFRVMRKERFGTPAGVCANNLTRDEADQLVASRYASNDGAEYSIERDI